jgi:hypothetical protein
VLGWAGGLEVVSVAVSAARSVADSEAGSAAGWVSGPVHPTRGPAARAHAGVWPGPCVRFNQLPECNLFSRIHMGTDLSFVFANLALLKSSHILYFLAMSASMHRSAESITVSACRAYCLAGWMPLPNPGGRTPNS